MNIKYICDINITSILGGGKELGYRQQQRSTERQMKNRCRGTVLVLGDSSAL